MQNDPTVATDRRERRLQASRRYQAKRAQALAESRNCVGGIEQAFKCRCRAACLLRLYREQWANAQVPFGYCWCGCGGRAPIALATSVKHGHLSGQPQFYILGHAGRKAHGWREEDRGYKTPCWIWLAATGDHGYGTLTVDGRTELAHIAAYAETGKSIPKGWQIDHLCRNRSCVNPAHLEPVPPALNTRRGLLAKLTQADVDAIRRASAPQATLAAIYGVHPSHISRIKNFKLWRPVEQPERQDTG